MILSLQIINTNLQNGGSHQPTLHHVVQSCLECPELNMESHVCMGPFKPFIIVSQSENVPFVQPPLLCHLIK